MNAKVYSGLLAAAIVFTACAADPPPPSKPANQVVPAAKAKQEAPVVIGIIETRNRTISLLAGDAYTIQDKQGKVLAENITAERLQKQDPRLYELLKTSLAKAKAGNDASLRMPRR